MLSIPNHIKNGKNFVLSEVAKLTKPDNEEVI